jgi:hypothetical protein
MSTQYAELNGVRVVSGSLTVPYYGAWSADLALATQDPIASAPMGCRVTVGPLVAVGTVYRSAPFAASRSVRLVGGAGGWRKSIPKRAYFASGGLSLGLVLGDAAKESGETLAIDDDGPIGDHMTRPTGPGARLLRELVSLWWIDPATGTTRVSTSRPSAPITSDFQVISWDAGRGEFQIATEALQDWLPGNTFTSTNVATVQTIAASTFRIEPSGTLRVIVLTTGAVAA